MQKMILEYAQKLLDGGYAFGNSFYSCNNDMLVVENHEGYYGFEYYGTLLVDGKLKTDDQGYVSFQSVKPIVDETTLWDFS